MPSLKPSSPLTASKLLVKKNYTEFVSSLARCFLDIKCRVKKE